jgi:acyl dehydratase
MATRQLDSSPRILPLYARAVAPLLPGASRLPWIAGGGEEVPDLRLALPRVRVERERLTQYAQVCGFAAGEHVPATYVHVLAFPLHLALMADGSFPFAAVGLVHVGNRIVQRRPIGAEERLDLDVRATPLQAHPRGETFSIVSEARSAGELVWQETSTMLHRGARGDAPAGDAAPAGATEAGPDTRSLPASGRWRLPGDLGRRYAAVSGDRNPIHLHALTARPLGFPRAIAHGMWTKARCLAALAQDEADSLAGAFSVNVRFRRPILLPATVEFARAGKGEAVGFGVRDAASGAGHLDGRIEPIDDGKPEQREAR